MGLIEVLSKRVGLLDGGEHEVDNRLRYFAPYNVWWKVRIVGLVGAACYLLPVPLLLLTGSAWPLILFLPALVIAPPLPGMIDNGFTALTPALIGYALGSRYCPSCAQSIFDDAPASGYLSDLDRRRWWPRRHCANCGHDLKQRTAE